VCVSQHHRKCKTANWFCPSNYISSRAPWTYNRLNNRTQFNILFFILSLFARKMWTVICTETKKISNFTLLNISRQTNKSNHTFFFVLHGCVAYWYGPERYQKHSFIGTVGIRPFNCWSVSQSFTPGPDCFYVVRCRTMQQWSHNVVLERLELFVYCGPVCTKLKWSVPINEHTQYNGGCTEQSGARAATIS
jgi:hypothetical protein